MQDSGIMSIQPTRIQPLNDADIRKGDYVLYWIQQSQQAAYNHALEYAVQQANKLNRMLLVAFDLMDNCPEANLRHYTFMHNYMRMYWGKKILDWSATPQKAFRATLAINNKYFLDGRDPVSYTGVGLIYGAHDRAWTERPIFGKTR